MVADLRKYFVDQMGDSEEIFRLMLSTPSNEIRYLNSNEMNVWLEGYGCCVG
jgi:hypothetical protein